MERSMSLVHLLKRTAGLGDVLMLQPVARALKCRDHAMIAVSTDAKIVQTLTGPTIPDVDFFIDATRQDDFIATQENAGHQVMTHDMNHPRHSLQRCHQIDSFLASFGLDPAVCDKEIRLPLHQSAFDMVDFYLDEAPSPSEMRGRVLLHPASGALNRTWPQKNWQELADRLTAAHVQVFTIGNRSTATGKGAFPLRLDQRLDVVDKFGFWETIELMKLADCVVSTDSAPIQMAAATHIAIVGIYSITKGEWRLPFRSQGRSLAIEPGCRFFPCYPLMYDEEHFHKACAHFDAQGIPQQNMLYEWCCDEYSYDCLKSAITVDEVFDAAMSTLPLQPLSSP